MTDRYAKETIEQVIKNAKTDRQVRSALAKSGYEIIRDNTEDFGTLSIWLDETTRIYRYKGRNQPYIVQKWKKSKPMVWSGTPVFFGNTMDKYF